MPLIVKIQFKTENEDILKLCKSYWEYTDNQGFVYTLKDLSQKFNIPINKMTKIVTLHCDVLSNNFFCSECQKPYIFLSRSEFTRINGSKWVWICDECKNKERERREEERKQAEIYYRKLIYYVYSNPRRKQIDPYKISLEEANYLTSFTRLYANEDFSIGVSSESVKEVLSPTRDMDEDILQHLFENKFIAVHPISITEAFEGQMAEKFDLFKVSWYLPIGLHNENSKDFADELEYIFNKSDWPNEWRKDCLKLWKKIALYECIQFLNHALGEHGFHINPGEKTKLVINKLLEDYSVAQIYNLIWRSTKDAAAFYIRERVAKKHAANTVIGQIQQYGEYAKAEQWNLKPYHRNFKCPQSMVSQVLFNAVLKIGSDGFNKIPDLNVLNFDK